MASHVPCKSLLSVARILLVSVSVSVSVARILLAFLQAPLRHVAFMSLRCNEMVSSKSLKSVQLQFVCNDFWKHIAKDEEDIFH